MAKECFMTTIYILSEIPKTMKRTILAVGRIHYQPPAGGQSETLDVCGWMVLQDETQPENNPVFEK
jgi:hypothetical protein